MPECRKCTRLATWLLVSISQPQEKVPTCKRHIPALMTAREEYVLYPLTVHKEDAKT